MKKYTNQKGQGLIEYALLLAIVVGIGSLIYSGSGLKDSISSIFGNSSNLLGVAASDAVNPSKDTVDDRNMKWLLGTFLECANSAENGFTDKLGNYMNKRNSPDFSENKPDGIIDSSSGSPFVGKIDSSTLGENTSWAFTGYTEGGETYYGVSIYDPAKNNQQKLSDLNAGDTITTDLYRVNPKTGEVTKLENNYSQTVASRTNNNKTYNVIRDTKK